MKTLLVFLALAMTMATSQCGKKETSPEPELVELNAEVTFVLHVYDEAGFEVTTDTEGVGFAADITIDAVAANPETAVGVLDPYNGSIQPAPYSYIGKLPHRSYQLFALDVISVSFKAEFVLFPGWKMECITLNSAGVEIHRNRANNLTGFPFELYVICQWP